ncbi:hypothetical protein FS837_005112 [Tulasnella sp. UAMH 9824]|nr:hypothetical protein FS837_005112 [Tulasnella sp. UAMH 9824]
MSPILLELNETTLVFLHNASTSRGHVSQVTLNYPKYLKEEIQAILKLDRLNEFLTPSLVKADGYSLLVGA